MAVGRTFSAAMPTWRYHLTFIDEEPKLKPSSRSKSAPPKLFQSVPSVFEEGRLQKKNLQNQVAHLEKRSQGLERQLVYPTTSPSLGSCGHPELCRRQCINFAKGTCNLGAECRFCHLSHPHKQWKLDKKQREILRSLSPSSVLAMLLPHFRRKVEVENLYQANEMIDMLERELMLRPEPEETQEVNVVKMSRVFEKMPLAALVGLVSNTQFSGAFPQHLKAALEAIRVEMS